MNEPAAYLRSELLELSAFLLLYVLICFPEGYYSTSIAKMLL